MTRWLCRIRHRGEYLEPATVGNGTCLRCRRCGAGFVGRQDAGLVNLGPQDNHVSAYSLARVLRQAEALPEPALEGGIYRVIRGGRLVADPHDAAGKRVVGGETVRVIRAGRSS
jgi:hypothetical protein